MPGLVTAVDANQICPDMVIEFLLPKLQQTLQKAPEPKMMLLRSGGYWRLDPHGEP